MAIRCPNRNLARGEVVTPGFRFNLNDCESSSLLIFCLKDNFLRPRIFVEYQILDIKTVIPYT
jgi:hypothetical protein